MILGIGVDSVEIERFKQWSSYTPKTLKRIFSPQEIEYCLQNPTKSAERFAVRFAAREAFFKALSVHQPEYSMPFLTLCRLITIEKNKNNSPCLIANWRQIALHLSIRPVEVLLSLTHTQQIATAFVVLQDAPKIRTQYKI